MDYYSDISKIVRERSISRFMRIFNSSLLFAFSYLILIITYQMTTGLMGKLSGFNVTINYYEVIIPKYSPIWSMFKVILIYSAGPLSLLALAIIGKILLFEFKNYLDLLALWLYVNGIALFMLQLLISCFGTGNYDSYFYQGFSVIFSWLGLPKFFTYVLAVVVLIILPLFGTIVSTYFLLFSFSGKLINNEKGKKRYFADIALIPFFFGAFISFILTYPKYIELHGINFIGIMIIIISAFVKLDYIHHMRVFKISDLQSFQLFPVIILILIFLLIQFLFPVYL